MDIPKTPSLAEALTQLRGTGYSGVMWVDRICIYQGNSIKSLHERSRQAHIMSRIDAEAEHDTLWLGPNSPLSLLSARDFASTRVL